MKTHKIFTKIPKLNCTLTGNTHIENYIMLIKFFRPSLSVPNYKSHSTSTAFGFASVTSAILASPLLTLSVIGIFLCLFTRSNSDGLEVGHVLQLGNTDRQLFTLRV